MVSLKSIKDLDKEVEAMLDKQNNQQAPSPLLDKLRSIAMTKKVPLPSLNGRIPRK